MKACSSRHIVSSHTRESRPVAAVKSRTWLGLGLGLGLGLELGLGSGLGLWLGLGLGGGREVAHPAAEGLEQFFRRVLRRAARVGG